jgi:1,4-alpha-glucan branching enzyme
MFLASGSQSQALSINKRKELRMKQLSDEKNAKQNVVAFVFPAPVARRVSLAGDFNNWDTEDMPMYKGSNGVWYLSVWLTAGSHEYRFISDGVWQDDPAAQQKIGNVMGSENCVKTVRAEIMREAA